MAWWNELPERCRFKSGQAERETEPGPPTSWRNAFTRGFQTNRKCVNSKPFAFFCSLQAPFQTEHRFDTSVFIFYIIFFPSLKQEEKNNVYFGRLLNHFLCSHLAAELQNPFLAQPCARSPLTYFQPHPPGPGSAICFSQKAPRGPSTIESLPPGGGWGPWQRWGLRQTGVECEAPSAAPPWRRDPSPAGITWLRCAVPPAHVGSVTRHRASDGALGVTARVQAALHAHSPHRWGVALHLEGRCGELAVGLFSQWQDQRGWPQVAPVV